MSEGLIFLFLAEDAKDLAEDAKKSISSNLQISKSPNLQIDPVIPAIPVIPVSLHNDNPRKHYNFR
jgi:hypothetical protein